ncbi:MAG: histidine phosphatase family protein [Bryobacterales bacterium]|nr:histidine phosphatase family protein [Bryobacterales bacterium]MDE0294094.1 histidine phosphatase family protein [Bryobacterales bacterium]
MARWFLVRHGETDWNSEGRIQGQLDTPLNEAGLIQARSLGLRLESIPFTAAYCSDLCRGSDTAGAVLLGRSLPIEEMPELREKKFGEWEGMTFLDVETRFPDLYHNGLMTGDPSFAPPGGESDLQLYSRAKAVAERLMQVHTVHSGNILVVSHGGTLSALITCLIDLPADKMWRFRFANAGISVVSVFDEGSAVLDVLNDTSHLVDGFRV